MPFVTLHSPAQIQVYNLNQLERTEDSLISEISGNTHELDFLMLTSSHHQYVGYLLMYELLWMLILHHEGLLTIVSLVFPVACQVLSLAVLFSSSFSPHPLPEKEDGCMWEWATVGIPTDCKTHNNKQLLPGTYHIPLRNQQESQHSSQLQQEMK